MKHYKIVLLLLLMFERVFNRLGHVSVVENRGRRRGEEEEDEMKKKKKKNRES